MRKSLRLCLISDTHGLHRDLDLPEASLVIHAGDAAMLGNLDHLRDFDRWVGEIGIPTILVPGNHDTPIVENPGLIRNAILLSNRGVRFQGLYIWGVPWSWPSVRRRLDYDAVPDVDVLVTHVPAEGVLDCGAGDRLLRLTLNRVRPRIHLCGHIHAGRGMTQVRGIRVCGMKRGLKRLPAPDRWIHLLSLAGLKRSKVRTP